MRLQEAYSTLELSSDATPAEAKKKYRELSKKFHPDINKEPNAEDKFKKINEAYSVVQSGKDNELQNFQSNPGINIEDFVNQHFKKQRIVREIHNSVIITFKEAVFGCKKDIQYKRNIKCDTCSGQGQKVESNGCLACGGTGKTVMRQGPMTFIGPCSTCKGNLNIKQCNTCGGKSVLEAETSIAVTVPGGVENGNVLRISGKGEYAGTMQNPFINQLIDQYTDMFLHLTVVQSSDFKVVDNTIITNYDISLLDALGGCTVEVITLDGQQTIQVPPSSKNKDIVSIPNLGVGRVGPHNVILNVNYPKDIDKLVDYLKNKDL